MPSNNIFSILFAILLLLVRNITAQEYEAQQQPNIMELLLNIPRSNPVAAVNNNCNIYNGEYHTACSALYRSNTESMIPANSPTIENCKFFTGNQFETCMKVHLLEIKKNNASISSSRNTCRRFTGEKSRFCTEMPAGYLQSGFCKGCKGEKVRFCLDIYKPKSNDTIATPSIPDTTIPSSTVTTTPKTRPLKVLRPSPSSVKIQRSASRAVSVRSRKNSRRTRMRSCTSCEEAPSHDQN